MFGVMSLVSTNNNYILFFMDLMKLEINDYLVHWFKPNESLRYYVSF